MISILDCGVTEGPAGSLTQNCQEQISVIQKF